VPGSAQVALRPRTKADHNTPDPVLDVIRKVRRIGLDPCSNRWSRVGALVELDLDRGDNGLVASWQGHGLCFPNPPYTAGQIPQWVDKAIREAAQSAREGRRDETIMLVPADCSTTAFQTAWGSVAAVCLWGSRIQFRGADRNGNPWPSVFWYWGHRAHRFCHIFEQHGIVESFGRRLAA